jgi:hypothetical protein
MCQEAKNNLAAAQRQVNWPRADSNTQLNIRGVNNGFIVEDPNFNKMGLMGSNHNNTNVFKTWSEVSDFISNYNKNQA